jgi:ABC-type transport system substrate-binding protein
LRSAGNFCRIGEAIGCSFARTCASLGTPFTADDVAFSFRAIYDRTVGGTLADSLRVGGQPPTVTATNARTVTTRFPSPFAPALRMLDGVPLYPSAINSRVADATPAPVSAAGSVERKADRRSSSFAISDEHERYCRS